MSDVGPPAPSPADLPTRFNQSLLAQTRSIAHAILDKSDSTFPRLQCPPPNLERYADLKKPYGLSGATRRPRFFFALDLYQCVHLLPRLLGSIIEAITFLGPENCVLSIVEGRSDDGTFEVLETLRADLRDSGVEYIFATSDIDPLVEGGDRIGSLAALRNLALQDLYTNPAHFDPETTIIFSNDVALCLEDILELLYQRQWQGADQTCAMDWWSPGDPVFYDVWVSRGMTGEPFFHIPNETGSWDFARDLFWNDDKTRTRFAATMPFQVFSCWGGVTAFTAKPFLEKSIEFRASKENECFQGEPKLLAKDFWAHGYDKIAVVPSVNVGYSDELSTSFKAAKGYVSSHVVNASHDTKIEWEKQPPQKVRCMPDFKRQYLVDWNEGLVPDVSEDKTDQ